MAGTPTKMPNGVEEKHIGIGLCMGVATGAVIGSIIGDVGFWVAIGCSAGLLLGILLPALLDGRTASTRPSNPGKPGPDQVPGKTGHHG